MLPNCFVITRLIIGLINLVIPETKHDYTVSQLYLFLYKLNNNIFYQEFLMYNVSSVREVVNYVNSGPFILSLR